MNSNADIVVRENSLFYSIIENCRSAEMSVSANFEDSANLRDDLIV